VTSLGSRSHLSLLLLIVLAVALTDCQQQINYPAPVLKALSPDSIQAGGPAFTLAVTGKSFTPSSAIAWNGQTLGSSSNPGLPGTIFVSSTELNVLVPAILIQNGGVVQVQVSTPQPGGGVTTPLPFTINGNASPVPQITSLSPSGAFTGNAGFTLIVSGKNFVSESTVTVNGNNHPTGFTSSTSLQASIFAADLATAGTLQIAVVNPTPNGGSSNSFPLSVKNQTPSLTSLTPTSAAAGGAATTIGLIGVGFVPNSVVTINGAARTTTFDSSTTLETLLTAGDLASAGINQVQVVSPAPGGGTSNIVPFAVNPTNLFGLPVLVDLARDGSQADNGVCGATCSGTIPTLSTAGPAASQTGQLVAFASNSTNLLANPTSGSSTIFLRNTCLASTTLSSSTCTPNTFQVSLTPSGLAPDGSSSEPSLDSTGAHVAYTSTASNLVNYVAVSGGTRQVYWQPTCTTTSGGTSGCTSSAAGAAALVSISADGTTPGNGESYNPVISADGQYVAFVSLATNLVQNVIADGVTPQVYIRSTCSIVPPASSSCVPATYLVSTADGTTPGNAASSHPAIANNGLFVAFASSASDLGATAPNPGGAAEIFERSTCVTTISSSSNTCVPATNLVSTPDGVTPADGASIEPAISSDGRFVAFSSTATTLITGVGPIQQVYVRDTCTGAASTAACVASTDLVSTPNGTTPANALSEHPSINQCGSTTSCASGQYVAFASLASNFGANSANGIENIFVRNSCAVLPTTTTACVPYTFLASQAGGSTPPSADGNSIVPAISGDGATVSFISFADNLVPRDTNALQDVFLAGANLTFDLTVALDGTGSGTVTDGTGQISCTQIAATSSTPLTESGTCTARYASGTSVTLTAFAGTSSTFTAWGGSATSVTGASCSVTTGTNTSGTCTFPMIQDNTATATFH
jgi:WD40-like Beta Propeller Repeat